MELYHFWYAGKKYNFSQQIILSIRNKKIFNHYKILNNKFAKNLINKKNLSKNN